MQTGILPRCRRQGQKSLPKHKEVRALPWSAEQMYDLVTDVARYPEFLPWVAAIRVRQNSDTEMLADMIVGFKAIKETFTSRVVKSRATEVHVDYVDGPLRYLRNDWSFKQDAATGGCQIEFAVDFEFKNRLFETLAGQYFDKALRKMTDAFVERAGALYGAEPGKSSPSATSAA
jgi:coenzyme Q-binding protein COQ10